VVVETLSLSCALPLEEACSPCLVLLLQLDGVFLVPSRATAAARVYLLVLVWLSGIILSSKG
jgi:hypothetical protein